MDVQNYVSKKYTHFLQNYSASLAKPAKNSKLWQQSKWEKLFIRIHTLNQYHDRTFMDVV